ncbi:hypothetical protein M527_22220 [Sphingobium indicum IP26]|uniref:HTH merR-type domain-containing protein n=1 Tax=Sphingobium indicum F2 TaxID=1450518 RepID=A0A8E0WV01_9SPHN|nr:MULTISPECIES: MerR family transcriptional regulator [Sphingobium]EPR16161.1 hypothetical protein M527_22220 [Sphingobium indicum IP26]EQB01979.1 hypothetical protein L286_14715 [Sphingobium sp. HDIP04]KER37901.1 hypothetical protein AL00_03400 [Sphingobium indicum F2]
MDPIRALYTRQQVGNLAGLDDTTLNYWSREGLLVPTEGGSGRGSHRRFDFVQVNIAAILGQLRRFGLNISIMRSFASLLQEAAQLGSAREIHPSNYQTAAHLATKLNLFRTGAAVMIPKHHRSEERPTNLHGEAYSDWLLAKRPAETEDQIIDDILGIRDDYDPIQAIVAVAEKIGPNRETVAKIYGELVFDLLAPGYSDAYSWLLGFGPDESWRIEFGFEGGKFFETIGGPSPEDFGPGIFLPVSGIIRKVWGLKTPSEYMRDREAERLRKTLAKAGIVAVITPNEHPDEGLSVNAPGIEWHLIEAVLNKAGFRSQTPVENSAQ